MNRIWDLAVQYQNLVGLVTAVSAAGVVLGIVAVSRLVAWLPSDYFMAIAGPGKPPKLLNRNVRVVKNLAGMVLIFLGIVMLVVPGQGLLTMFLGLAVMDFPGKKKVILHLIRLKTIQGSLNWIRRKKRRPPFVFPDLKNR
ncbi:MAG TPA: PGPGW domain-containing protein [Desulfotignum sp.]|jgi:hypothetical protein|nr:PGPGW domain-containing protein [Desulfotignum sp.]